jgi:hypothetical protein
MCGSVGFCGIMGRCSAVDFSLASFAWHLKEKENGPAAAKQWNRRDREDAIAGLEQAAEVGARTEREIKLGRLMIL